MTDNVIVSTENGKVRGKVLKDYHGGKFYSFTGIPYAKAPIGELRFKAPVPLDPWEGIKNATKEGPECPSMMYSPKLHTGKEDNCLNLNVYTKELPKSNENPNKIPVMFYLHGGGFVIGSNKKKMCGPRLLMTENIVLVVINYRLGVLGFLSLKDESLGVPGNAGLKDQVMALKWVQNNISKFGGDPNNVTIFGQSAGSASVHYLTLSPTTKGLFHKAILQSGCALNPWARGRHNAADIARLMGYDPDIEEKTFLEILRQASTKSIVGAQFKLPDTTLASMVRPFGPVIEHAHEGAFLSEEPMEIMKSGRNHQIPMIIGYTSLEGLLFELFRMFSAPSKVPYTLEQDIPYEFNISDNIDETSKIVEEIKQFYFDDKDLSQKNVHNRYEMCGDILFVHGIQKTIGLLKKYSTSPVFVYKMTVMSSLNFLTNCCQSNYIKTSAVFSFLMKLSGTTPFKSVFQNLRKKLMVKKIDGISHGDDAFYLFNTIISPKVTKGSDEDVYIQRFVKLWTNFATFGDPTPELLDVLNNTKWNPIADEKIKNVLEIGNTMKVIGNMESDRIEFWDKLYQQYAHYQY